MALDSRNKRASALGAGLLALTVFAVPSGISSAETRRQDAGYYSFAAPATPVPPVAPSTGGGGDIVGGGGKPPKPPHKGKGSTLPPLLVRRIVTDLRTPPVAVKAAVKKPTVPVSSTTHAVVASRILPAVQPLDMSMMPPPLLDMQLKQLLKYVAVKKDDEQVFALLRQQGIL